MSNHKYLKVNYESLIKKAYKDIRQIDLEDSTAKIRALAASAQARIALAESLYGRDLKILDQYYPSSRIDLKSTD